MTASTASSHSAVSAGSPSCVPDWSAAMRPDSSRVGRVASGGRGGELGDLPVGPAYGLVQRVRLLGVGRALAVLEADVDAQDVAELAVVVQDRVADLVG